MRQRVVNNENDENAAPARVTRAKAAALGGPDELSEGMVKKALQSKKASSGTINGAAAQRKRTALADVKNITKAESSEEKAGKKASVGRPALGSKSTNAGVQKVSRANSTRPALSSKDASKQKSASSDLKRSASDTQERAIKKRATGSGASQMKEETPAAENQPPKKTFAVEIEQTTAGHTIETVKVQPVETRVKSEPRDTQPSVTDVEEDEVFDLDSEDLGDPLMVAEYAVEIFEYLKELEMTTLPNPDYMAHQGYIEWGDRDILNDWLVQVHQRFQLLPETFYLAINIIDRFLSNKMVQLDKLQLVGITAMFIASKYEEVISPHVSNFSYMAKDYKDEEILSAERFILSALNYDLSYPNPMNFLRRISKADNYDIQTRTLGKYLLEISMLDHRFLQFPPSRVAAAAMYMSRMILKRGDWVCRQSQGHDIVLTQSQTPTLAHYAGYTEDEILPVFNLMLDYCSGDILHEAFHSKYASKKYLKGEPMQILDFQSSNPSQRLSLSDRGLKITWNVSTVPSVV